MSSTFSIRIRGVVQGVGFRPFVYRMARAHTLSGWVLNNEQGVEIHVEGTEQSLQGFVRDLKTKLPAAAAVSEIDIHLTDPLGLLDFTIHESGYGERRTARVSADLPVCEACLTEMFDPSNRRYGYPYINCTDCGPRYTVIL